MKDDGCLIIGIAGAKRSGKTTLANLLAENQRLSHASFAAPLRAFVADLLGGTVEQLEEWKEAPIAWLDGKTPRHIMQTLGTEWGRQMIHPDLWVRVAMRDCGARAVFSDVRFPNEALAIRDAGGCVIRLHRAGAQSDGHVSERPLDNSFIDCELLNNRDPDELLRRALGFISEWTAGKYCAWGAC